jgi:iron complex transport system substrate-binding protein
VTTGAKHTKGISGRLRAALVGVAVTALALTGCASADGEAGSTEGSTEGAEGGASSAEFPITFENADGTTTEIPEQPTNIASTAVTITGSLLSFGAPVTSSGAAGNGQFFPQWADVAESAGVETLWPAGEVDLEALIAADPDLIVVAASGADSAVDNLADFQDIAPTIVVDYGGETWQELTLELAEATGLTEAAEETISGFEEHVAEVKEQITVPEGEANVISFNGPGENNPIARDGGPHAELLNELGFTIEDPNPEWHNQDNLRNDFVWASYENLTELTADTTFILAQGNEGAQAFLDDTVLANLPSVQNGQVYGLGENSFRIDYYSATEIVDGVLENFGTE